MVKTLKDLEEQVAYFNYCVVDGSKKMFENRTEVYSKHFIEYCEIHKALSEKVIPQQQKRKKFPESNNLELIIIPTKEISIYYKTQDKFSTKIFTLFEPNTIHVKDHKLAYIINRHGIIFSFNYHIQTNQLK